MCKILPGSCDIGLSTPAGAMSSLPISIKTSEDLVITVKKGCVTKEDVDVVINSTSENLELNVGTLSSSILRAAGSEIQEECKGRSPSGIKRGQVVDTSAGNMPARSIYHGALSPWLNGNGEADLLAFVRCFLDKADIEKKKSMAIPAITTGTLKFPPKVVAKVMHEEIVKFSRAIPNTSLKDIRILLICEPQLTEFVNYFGSVLTDTAPRPPLAPRPPPAPHFVQNVVSYLGSMLGVTARHPQPAHAEQQSSTSSSSSDSDTDSTDESLVLKVNIDSQVTLRMKKGNITEAKTDIVVNAVDRDIRLNHGAVSNAIRRAAGESIESECKEKAPQGLKYGEMVKTSGGRLQCKAIYHVVLKPAGDNPERDLRAVLSLIFENAAVDGYTSVTLPSLGTGLMLKYPAKLVVSCIIKELEQFCAANTGTAISDVDIVLFHQDHASISAFQKYLQSKYNVPVRNTSDSTKETNSPAIPKPGTWSRMDKDQLYKIDTLHSSSDEYKAVYKRFTDSRGPRNVKKIQRVQCPQMYDLFSLRRGQVEKNITDRSKYKVEETLFHGTSRDVLPNINLLGFNRSYGGKNATSLGLGTYFAKEASYSCNDVYSPKDKDGYKYVYQCRVLTGEYTAGSQSLKQPPNRPGSNVPFDSVVNNVRNPTVFVVFYDAQAYPEYLITFKE